MKRSEGIDGGVSVRGGGGREDEQNEMVRAENRSETAEEEKELELLDDELIITVSSSLESVQGSEVRSRTIVSPQIIC